MCMIKHMWVRIISLYSNSLWARWSRDQIAMEARFSATIQTGPVAHTAFCTMGAGSVSRWPYLYSLK